MAVPCQWWPILAFVSFIMIWLFVSKLSWTYLHQSFTAGAHSWADGGPGMIQGQADSGGRGLPGTWEGMGSMLCREALNCWQTKLQASSMKSQKWSSPFLSNPTRWHHLMMMSNTFGLLYCSCNYQAGSWLPVSNYYVWVMHLPHSSVASICLAKMCQGCWVWGFSSVKSTDSLVLYFCVFQ